MPCEACARARLEARSHSSPSTDARVLYSLCCVTGKAWQQDMTRHDRALHVAGGHRRHGVSARRACRTVASPASTPSCCSTRVPSQGCLNTHAACAEHAVPAYAATVWGLAGLSAGAGPLGGHPGTAVCDPTARPHVNGPSCTCESETAGAPSRAPTIALDGRLGPASAACALLWSTMMV